MNSQTSQFPSEGLSRRQFGLVVGGGAFLVLAGGTYGVIGRSLQDTATGAATAFGSLTIVRAGRLARLDARGRPAFRTLAAAASHLAGVTGADAAGRTRFQRASAAEEPGAGGHSHDGGTPEDPAGPEPVNLTWADVVLLEVKLQNDELRPVLFSPGQLRLKLTSSSVTITPQDSDRVPGPIAPQRSEHLLVSYLAPRDSRDLELEYSDEQRGQTLLLPLPVLTTYGARP